MPATNYYHTLQIGRDAGDFEIKNAYRRLSLKYHPHKDSGNADVFRDIAEAYTVLIDPIKRSKFDQYGEGGLKDGVLEQTWYKGYQYVGDPMELFYNFFGETSPDAILFQEKTGKLELAPRAVNHDSVDAATELELRCSLEELYRCAVKCQKIERRRFDKDMKSYVDSKCLTIKIEKGWKPGMKLRFKGEGNQLHPSEKKATDICFVVLETPHPVFERILDTYDLLYIHKCSLLDALTGHVINLELLDDSMLNLHVSETVSPGYEKRILEHGLQKPDGTFGDLVIRWDIRFPDLDSDQKEALKQILKKK